MTIQLDIIIVMVGYLSLLIAWGIFQGKKVKTAADYAIAGRKLPGWAAALSERATGESAWALLGLPGFAYAMGLASLWTALGCVAGIVVAWMLLAARLRDEAERKNAHTFTELISSYHPQQAASIRVLSSLIITFFFFFYIGAQFLGGGKTLFNLIGLDQRWGMLLTALIIIPYTVYGGLRSVVYTDVVQSLLMITTLVIAPIFGFWYLHQHPEVFAPTMVEALQKAGPKYTSLTQGFSGFAAGAIVMGGLSWFFGYLGGQPQLSIRFMAIRDQQQAKQARMIGLAWTIFAYLGALCIGWIGLALFGPQGLQDAEYVMPAVLLKLFPPAIAAILITGAIAAMISTADSLLILCSTELANNLLPAKHNPASRLRQSRLITAALAIIALLLAYVAPSQIIYTLVGYVWAGIGGTFSVVVLLSLFWRKFHGRAALVTIAAGLLFTIFWIRSGLDEIITARVMTFVFTFFIAIAASYLLPDAKKRVCKNLEKLVRSRSANEETS